MIHKIIKHCRKSSSNKPMFYDTGVGSNFFGDTVKDKEKMDFDELLRDVQTQKTTFQTISASVKQGIVPNRYQGVGNFTTETNKSKSPAEIIPKVSADIDQPKQELTLEKSNDQREVLCRSVAIQRRAWNTSASK